MSTLALPPHEKSIRRPTSRRVVYDVRQVLHDGRESSLYENFRTPLEDTRKALMHIASWKQNWDGEGSAKPNIRSILGAIRWIHQMRLDATSTAKPWMEPHVVPDENGDIAFEWRNNNRNLIVYVSPESVYYLRVWGPEVDSQMADGEVADSEDNKKMWRWLME